MHAGAGHDSRVTRNGSWHDAVMDESRAAPRKALADAAHRPSDDAVSDLLRDLEAAPKQVAQADDLDDLARRAQAGDQQAREELIERMLPLVNSIARGYRTAGLERADLVQEGCVGILRALRRFDPDRGVPFSIYAALWIRQARNCDHSRRADAVVWSGLVKREFLLPLEVRGCLLSKSLLDARLPDQPRRHYGAGLEGSGAHRQRERW